MYSFYKIDCVAYAYATIIILRGPWPPQAPIELLLQGIEGKRVAKEKRWC